MEFLRDQNSHQVNHDPCSPPHVAAWKGNHFCPFGAECTEIARFLWLWLRISIAGRKSHTANIIPSLAIAISFCEFQVKIALFLLNFLAIWPLRRKIAAIVVRSVLVFFPVVWSFCPIEANPGDEANCGFPFLLQTFWLFAVLEPKFTPFVLFDPQMALSSAPKHYVLMENVQFDARRTNGSIFTHVRPPPPNPQSWIFVGDHQIFWSRFVITGICSDAQIASYFKSNPLSIWNRSNLKSLRFLC